MEIDWRKVEPVIEQALAEDLVWGDVTTDALIPSGLQGRANFIIKADGVLAGTEVARRVFGRVDPALHFESLVPDGSRVKPGDVVAKVEGSVSSILKGERVALNFLQRLSGIATVTGCYVEATKDTSTRILDTRKTAPGLRVLEKYAVKTGGGFNHRAHLGDGILIKDNHIDALRWKGMQLKDIVAEAKRKAPHNLKVEVEARNIEEAIEAVIAGADIVLLDNMKVKDMRHAVELIAGRALIEASGGITLDNVREVAETGVDFISIGALTHSVKALDISLKLDKVSC